MSDFQLTEQQLAEYRETGHLTVDGLFSSDEVAAALRDIDDWSREFLASLTDEQRAWYLERGTQTPALRKLDNPAYQRPVFRQMASHPRLLKCVEQLIGPGLRVWFSQVFMKPPGGGGPKPVHQDNFYFGPSDLDGVITAWLALDDATTENGCLYYADGTNNGPVLDHFAPEGEPFNLQIPVEVASQYEMMPAPVMSGGVSFHHGNTLHQSSDNRSDRPRRAVAFHYVNAETDFANPALKYDLDVIVEVAS
jgi:phytanoyl-CoA hydroxylase